MDFFTAFFKRSTNSTSGSQKINVFWVLIGNIVASAFTYLMIVLLSKLGSPEALASYGLAQAIALPVSTFLTLRLRTVLVTDAANEYAFSDYYGLAVLAALVAVVLIGTIAVFSERGPGIITVILLGAYYASNIIRQVFLAVIQKSERMHFLALAQALAGLLNFLFFAVLYYFYRQLYLALFGYFFSQVIVLLLFDYPLTKKLIKGHQRIGEEFSLIPTFDFERLVRLAYTSFPLGIVALLGTLLTSIPRLVMDNFVERKLIGYYVAISSLLVFGNLIMVAVGQAISPRLARYYLDYESVKGYLSLLIKFVLVSLFIGASGLLISFVLGRTLLSVLFTPEYTEYVNLLHIIMGAGLFLFLFSAMNTALNAARCFAVQVPVFAVVAMVCFISSVVFIPRFGLYGAAYSVTLSYFLGFIITMVLVGIAVNKKLQNSIV